jgi:uncharacterized protein (TIGR00369 family)
VSEPASIPEGFKPARTGGQFIAQNGPLYARLVGDRLQLGFRVEERHTNPLNICHGGMLATFADMLLPCVALYQAGIERRFLPTISLQADFLAQATLGAWVQGQGEVLRTTRNMIFVQALVTVDSELAMRISGVLKQGPLMDDGSGRDPLKLLG